MNPCEVNEIGVEQASGWCNGFVSEQDESRTVGWFAFGSAGYREVGDDDDAYGSVSGTRIRLMCDHGVAMPLWDEDGLLPEDTDWIERELGLSRSLIADLTALHRRPEVVTTAVLRVTGVRSWRVRSRT